MNGRLQQLLQLSDSGLPTGSYAFSNGLEAAYHLGLCTSADALDAFLRCALDAAAGSEVPFIHSCYALGEVEGLGELLTHYDAMQTVPSVLRASLLTGKTWMRLFDSMYPEANLATWCRSIQAQALPLHFTVVFAQSLKSAGFAAADTQRLFMFQTLRDQMSAAVRLGIVGPLQAAQRQRHLVYYGERALERVAGRAYWQAARSTPQLDIAQGVHGYLYSRLFQS